MEKDITILNSQNELSQLLNEPEIKIAEFLTGALSVGKSEAILIGGKLVQGALKGNFMKQLGREIEKLIENGKIKEDYAKEKYGFQTFVEILSFIDEELPDIDKFNAVKSLFYSIIDKDIPDGEEIIRYQLFKICKRLTSSQLFLLITVYKIKDSFDKHVSATIWLKKISETIGNYPIALIEKDENFLKQERLISSRRFSDRSGVDTTNGGLTDLELKLVENILNYDNFYEDDK